MSGLTKEALKAVINESNVIEDSTVLAQEKGWDHDKMIGLLKSLEADEQVKCEPMKREGMKLTDEGEAYLVKGSPEAQIFNFVKSQGSVTSAEIDKEFGLLGKVGMGAAMKNKWVAVDKATKAVTPAVEAITDDIQVDLKKLASLPKDKIDVLKKRKMVAPTSTTVMRIIKTEKFSLAFVKDSGEITAEMIQRGTWSSTTFKPFNLVGASGRPCGGGHLHPLLKVRTEIRNILLLMGFEEMKTNQWVESSFWNFDSLFQPQQHPARDAHDTFFIESPSHAQNIPADYLERVKEMHEHGGQGSIGWRYDWSELESRTNILRTHTTAVSARTLYVMGQEFQKTGVFTPKKYFSIDRVFRNETLDATHLAEFHQCEGFIADRNIGLAQLIGVIREFFRRMGLSNLRFKPAYNPYTEPSMEIFGFHPFLNKWIELGNSGVFRPEMLLPMGLPEDVSVIAWGISLERPTMIQYGINNIRDLFGFKQDIALSRTNPVCWLKAAVKAADNASQAA